jgi:uncharacterized damage-inducible protein DinB
MRYRIAVEDIETDHWVAWALDLPGCYSRAKTSSQAIALAPASIARYYDWITSRDSSLVTLDQPFEIEVVEVFHSYPSQRDPEYVVNAFFEDDNRPLCYWEIVIIQRLLDWSHDDFWQALLPAGEGQLEQPIAGEVQGSIAGVVQHVANAENWYLGMLGLGLEQARLPPNPIERIDAVRNHTKQQLWKLTGETRITENYDEQWSARKVCRRLLWHERDHTQHIRQLRSHAGPGDA